MLTSARPGTLLSASATECSCRASRSAPSITVTLDATSLSGTSTWLAETTIASEIALTLSVSVPRSRGVAVESTVTASARKPSSATRTVARPSPRGWSVKRPSLSVSADVVAAAPDETKTLAPGTGRPASSTTRPVMGAAASARAEARIRNVVRTRN